MVEGGVRDLRAALLRWGAREGRELPWRGTRDPWAVLVSEVMLQQTQVARVVERWPRFLEQWPTPGTCASAELADLLGFWQGLGYPRRVRNLWRAARVMVEEHDGCVPRCLDDLLRLPGVGPYTARAVLVFAFEDDIGMVDTNVGRILARWSGAPLTPAAAQRMADEMVPAGRAWHWGQALFDLGAAVCARRDPQCDRCPVAGCCRWALAGRPSPDPAQGSAAVGRAQPQFEGSNRQARGRILKALDASPVDQADVAALVGIDDADRLGAIVDGLVADGLVSRMGRRLTLGEEP